MLNKEETCASLNHTRIDSSLVAFGDCVYAIGGHHNGSDIHEIEEYDTRQHNTKILKKKWKDVSRIPDKIKLHCAPCVVHDNTIYIIGEKNEGQASTVVISFKPEGKFTHCVNHISFSVHAKMSTFYWKVTTRCENVSVCVKLQEDSVTTANVNVRFMKYCFTVRQLLRKFGSYLN
jgi:hypothetical protein